MDLLPQTHAQFSSKKYWDSFFKKRGKEAFEWYGEYPELCGILHKFIKPQDNILMIGCGNSKLSEDLYDVGIKAITNIDISEIAINQMRSSNKNKRPDMVFTHMDATDTSFKDASFKIVLDKGTLDALMPDESQEVLQKIEKLFSEIARVLSPFGRYICVSLLQEHILKKILSYFFKPGWALRIVRCFEAEQKTAASGKNSMPVFVVIATLFKTATEPILEVCLNGDKITRLNNVDQVISAIQSIQDTALVCSGLNRTKLSDNEEVSLDLFKPGEKIPRYTIHVVDLPKSKDMKEFAAFIVPQGRETEWMFSTKPGRRQLAESASFSRIAIVCMHRNQKYENLDSVQSELSSSIMTLAPHGLKGLVPYLSLGPDLGERILKFKGSSEFSGEYIIEDVVKNKEVFRQLIFLNNQFVVQSEAKINLVKTSKGYRDVVNKTYVCCQHHIFMALAISHLRPLKNQTVLVVGLGGGSLCNLIQCCYPAFKIIGVDIDPAMLSIATQWFGLTLSKNMSVEISDGIKYLEKSKSEDKKFKAILFDVDSKDSSLGMSCPPKEFIEKEVLNNVRDCLEESGIFILNYVARESSLRPIVLNELKNVFRNVCSFKMTLELNEIFYCTNNDQSLKEKLIKSAAWFNKDATQKTAESNAIDLDYYKSTLIKN